MSVGYYLRSSRSIGFTLVELLIALAVVSILALLATPSYLKHVEKAATSKAIQDIGYISGLVSAHYLTTGYYPSSLAIVGAGDMRDPWGNPYHYLNITTLTNFGQTRKDRNLVPINNDFDLYSSGPDGRSVGPLTARASRDDIVRGGNGGFIGVAENF